MNHHMSPWLEELSSKRIVKPLVGKEHVDVAIVGGGIAGVATAFEILTRTNSNVMLIEADLIAHGASGHGSGQVATVFEGGFPGLSERFGPDMAEAAFQQVFSAKRLFSRLVVEAGSRDKVHQVNAFIGFSSIESVEAVGKLLPGVLSLYIPATKLYAAAGSGWNCMLRDSGMRSIRASPQIIMEKLGTIDENYRAMAVTRTNIANIAAISDGLVERMLLLFPDRFRLHERTSAISVRSDQPMVIQCESGQVECKRAVICTNGYPVPDLSDTRNSFPDDYLHCVAGYMNGYSPFSKEERVGVYFHEVQPSDDEPYIYSTSWANGHGKSVLMVGGPQFACDNGDVIRNKDEKAHARIDHLAAGILGIKEKAKVCWDGRMGYTSTGARLAGPDPVNSNLYYNLGCNGVGILHSIYGARRIADGMVGKKLEGSIFEPRLQF